MIEARLHGAARAAVGYSTISILFQQLNAKGYPHLSLSFHRWLQVYIWFWIQVVSEKKITFSPLSYGRMFLCDNDGRETLAI